MTSHGLPAARGTGSTSELQQSRIGAPMRSTSAWSGRESRTGSRERVKERPVAHRSKYAIEQAEAKFRKRPEDAASAALDMHAERSTVQDKIARLRALRLAKEAAEMQVAAAAKPGAKKTR